MNSYAFELGRNTVTKLAAASVAPAVPGANIAPKPAPAPAPNLAALSKPVNTQATGVKPNNFTPKAMTVPSLQKASSFYKKADPTAAGAARAARAAGAAGAAGAVPGAAGPETIPKLTDWFKRQLPHLKGVAGPAAMIGGGAITAKLLYDFINSARNMNVLSPMDSWTANQKAYNNEYYRILRGIDSAYSPPGDPMMAGKYASERSPIYNLGVEIASRPFFLKKQIQTI